MENTQTSSSIKLVSLILLLVSSILSIGNWHIAAQFGISSIFYLIFSSLFFMVPVSFVSAELASSYQSFGGIFTWVKEAFGMKLAVLCGWLMWVSNVVWYPTVFTFMATSLIYYFDPPLSENRLFIFIMMNILFWLGNLVNLYGYQFSSKMISFSVVLGMIIPAILLIGLGGLAYYFGFPAAFQIPMNFTEFLPRNQEGAILLTGLLLGFTGMEMAMIHFNKVHEPKKLFPKAIWLAAFLLIIISILGTLGISQVIPCEKINLISDSIDAIYFYLKLFKIDCLMPYINTLISVGSWVGMSAYLAEPSKAFFQAVKISGLSKQLEKSNSNSIPITIMLLQGVLFSIISVIFFTFENLTDFYWMLTDLASQLYLLIYCAMFWAVIKLKVIRKIYPINIIPFGQLGVWFFGIIGFLLSAFCFFMGCHPPKNSTITYPVLYSINVVLMIGLMTCIPLIGLKYKQFMKKRALKNLSRV